MAPERRPRRRYCGRTLPAALPVTPAPNGAVRLNHLAARHCAALRRLLTRLAAGEDIATVAAEASEVIEGDEAS